ncbi:hypothetical protein BDZ94DRAFT_1214956 [Collybia nuda]|uniref:BTB domain-containing protein n=1 Tax=Collybia nuda TaxID=64659 RepID=A0A9P5YCE6_9AGAR|nr:hypothetical protein BDZ94DRAFT_1214956 [Collybia nuda]
MDSPPLLYGNLGSSSINSPPPIPWYEDGNLVLEAGNTRFRISKGVLAAQSPVFQEMLSFPQPPDEEAFDGCPVVRLYDSPDDVGYFLKAIYDSSYFEPPPSPTEISIVAGVLRLSTKYQVDYLRHRAIRHLGTLYPLTLAAFDKRQETRTTPWKDNTAFFVSLLVRELDLLWVLPSVLYCVCSCPVEDIVQGFLWNGSRMQMNGGDRAKCLQALLVLANLEHRDILNFLTLSSVEGCSSPGACNTHRLTTLRSLNTTRDILNPLDSFDEWEWYLKELCQACLEVSKRSHFPAREALWESLPEIFGLPKWLELDKLRRKALEKA